MRRVLRCVPASPKTCQRTVRTAIRFLDRVIDINYYPTPQAATSNPRWRPVGLGVMGLQDVFFTLGLSFDAPRARELSTRIAEEIALTALETSVELAREHGPHPAFDQTRAARGVLHLDHFDVVPAQPARWVALRAAVAKHGLRNALLIAIAPTATIASIASIAGCYECIEPQISTVFKRETLSGEFLQLNNYLVAELKPLASGTNWVFRDESMHMAFAFDVVRTVRAEEPDLVDDAFEAQVRDMLTDAVAAETTFAQDLLRGGIPGMTVTTMRTYLEHVADRRLIHLGFAPIYRSANPFAFLELQDVQELSNFFERRVSAYQIAISGTVNFDTDF